MCPTPTNATNGTGCDDGNGCTQSDSCQSGACVGANPVTCPAAATCKVAGTCNPSTGQCSAQTNAGNGTSCSDGNACTQTDSCQNGTCTGSNPVTCPAAATCKVAGTCNPSTGQCSAPTNAGNGTPCSDGNACTQTDTCQSGACTGSNPVSCPAPAACHTAGTCNTGTGVCSTPNAPDNSSCTSSLYGSCQTGACACYQGVSAASCTSGASCLNWGFESGTTEGWGVDPLNTSNGVTNITVSSSRFHSGSRSLALTLGISAYSTNEARGAEVQVPLCASTGTVNLAGYSFSAWVYYTVTSGSIPMNAANLTQGMFHVRNSPTLGVADGPVAVSQSNLNQWLHMQGSINQTNASNYMLEINVGFPIADPASEGFAGTMYIDDVQLTPP